MKKLVTTLVVLLIIVVIFVLLGPFYIVEQGEQAVVTRFGKIVTTNTEPGLKFKVPVIDNVVKYSKKILSWDGDAQRVPTAENQFIWVDATARWKISDPQKFYEAVSTLEQGWARLDDVIDSTIRTVITSNNLREAVRNTNIINELEATTEILQQQDEEVDEEELRELTQTEKSYEKVNRGREELSQEMFELAAELTPDYGIELVDIIMRQIRYSDDLTESVYSRMIKERNQIAEAYRSYGQGKKAEWLGKLENERKTILSEAYQESEGIRGEADAEATLIYAQAYEQDPEFFEFWRSIESYRKTMPQFTKTLTTDMDYFKYLYNEDGTVE
ncbi:MAG: protease modulator HflC [Spirochaetaceae bacterium]|nr:protease modulator HflC [Spirochaetaceae bacterium]MCF7949802.1 protease modulator HflC [Spirochaetia bacterium]MCF7950885.1 protease modulator HflC [Spirochaetaceae bacterium]